VKHFDIRALINIKNQIIKRYLVTSKQQNGSLLYIITTTVITIQSRITRVCYNWNGVTLIHVIALKKIVVITMKH